MEQLSRRELLLCSLNRQYLLEQGDKRQVVGDLLGLQAQFAQNPGYALRIRARDFAPETWGQGLVKIWSHRGTIHVVRQDQLGLLLSARGVDQQWQAGRWGLSAAQQDCWAAFLLDQVGQGVEHREALKQACRQAGMDQALLEKVFYGWGGLLKEMCDRGLLVYQSGTEKRFALPGPIQWMDRDQARLAVLEQYFQTYGPATLADCAAFTGWKMAEIRPLAGELSLRQVRCGQQVYYYLGELNPEGRLPGCLFLAGFDQLVLGYRDRSRILDPEDRGKLTNAAGIVYPAILLRGRIRARWKKAPGRLEITPFRPLTQRDQDQISRKGNTLFAEEKLAVEFLPPVASCPVDMMPGTRRRRDGANAPN